MQFISEHPELVKIQTHWIQDIAKSSKEYLASVQPLFKKAKDSSYLSHAIPKPRKISAPKPPRKLSTTGLTTTLVSDTPLLDPELFPVDGLTLSQQLGALIQRLFQAHCVMSMAFIIECVMSRKLDATLPGNLLCDESVTPELIQKAVGMIGQQVQSCFVLKTVDSDLVNKVPLFI